MKYRELTVLTAFLKHTIAGTNSFQGMKEEVGRFVDCFNIFIPGTIMIRASLTEIKCLGGNATRTSPDKVVKDKTVLGLSDLLPAILARERTVQAASGKILFSTNLF